jgi:hypothetical protein
VYEYTNVGMKIFMWEASVELGVFVEIQRSLVGKLALKVSRTPFSRN